MSEMSKEQIEELIERLEQEGHDAFHKHYSLGMWKLCDEAAAALRQLLNPWKGIESAPKDGTEILGYRSDCGVMLIRWSAAVDFMTSDEIEESGMTDEELHAEDWFCADFVQGCLLEGDEVPTHWMLPHPPASPEAEECKKS